MDRSLEARQWRRSFAAGTIALGMSLGGHFATVSQASPSCPLSAQRASVIEKAFPRIHASQIAQRVARAVLGLMLRQSCG
jgi:hypothetical protein